jgi:hypothetical protein
MGLGDAHSTFCHPGPGHILRPGSPVRPWPAPTSLVSAAHRLALHLSPTEEEAGRLPCYWQTRGDNLPLEVIVLAHRAVVAPLVNHIWTYSGPAAPVSRLDR